MRRDHVTPPVASATAPSRGTSAQGSKRASVESGEDLLTYAEASRFLRRPVGTLQAQVSRREIAHVRQGPRSVVAVEAVGYAR